MIEASLLHRLVRAYTFNTPVKRGRYRLALTALKFGRELPAELTATTSDGRSIRVDPNSHSYRFVYFLGEYEPAITSVFRAIVRKGDVCIDVGGNIGWFTTLFQKLVGPEGKVHSFEPIPSIFEKLSENVWRNEPPKNVVLNNVVLGDTESMVELHLFNDLPHGHSSISTFGRENYSSVECPMITLNSYLEKNNVGDVDIIKMDIEGAELMMLKGADVLFQQGRPPLWVIEMALGTTRGFGYLPNDLIEFMRSKADYDFYSIDERSGCLQKFQGFKPNDAGANVLCIPSGYYEDRLAGLRFSAGSLPQTAITPSPICGENDTQRSLIRL